MPKTKIEWTEYSWNPIRGTLGNWHCTHVSEGCRNCYAERMNIRYGGPEYKPGADTFRLHEGVLNQPTHWRKPRRVFVCSMTDLFHELIPEFWVHRIFHMMTDSPKHTFQILTKRPERMLSVVSSFYKLQKRDAPLPNVWLGVSCEDQKTADERVPLLLQVPAAIRWISAEPLLGPIDLGIYLAHPVMRRHGDLAETRLNWVVVGGESGPKARPMHPDWARSIRDQCQKAGVAFFMKQWGEYAPAAMIPGNLPAHWITVAPDGKAEAALGPPLEPGNAVMGRVGKKKAGRILDGKKYNEYPKGEK